MARYRARLAAECAGIDWQSWAAPVVPPGTYSAAALAEVALDALVHAELVRRFVLFADYSQHPVKVESFLWHLHESRRPALSRYFNGQIKNRRLEMFAVAQHHGIPTGFLDWTYNPLVAAYFAAAPSLTSAASQGVTVWALRAQLLDIEAPLRRMTVRAGITPFLDAQEGLFTWCPSAYHVRLQTGRYPNFDELIAEMDADARFAALPRPFCIKVTLPEPEVLPLMKLLWRERVTPAHLMPTFDNIKRALELEAAWGTRPGGFAPAP
jgi:hypothetical protein